MALLAPFIFVSAFWLALHALARFYRLDTHSSTHSKRRSDRNLLPTSRNERSRTLNTTLGICWASISTSQLNLWPGKVVNRLDLRRVYNYGGLLVCCSQPIAVIALAYLSVKQMAAFWSPTMQEVAPRLVKRATAAMPAAQTALQPLVRRLNDIAGA